MPAPAEKLCASCGAGNPPAAKFCFDCGTPFAKKAPPPAVEAKAEPKRGAEPEVKARPDVKPEPAKPEPPKPFARPDLGDATSESAPVSLFTEAPPDAAPLAAAAWGEEPPAVELAEALHDESLAAAHEVHAEPAPEHVEELTEAAPAELLEEAPAVEGFEELHAEEATPAEEPAFAEEALPEEFAAELGEPLGEAVEEALAPFHASLIVEKGAAPGTAFLLGLMHNSIGAAGAHVELAEDPFIAPQAATLLFADDHLVLRDEGTANGVFVKIRETANLEAGDQFTAGERLFRYDGVVELAKNEESATPFLGAPRPQGPQAVRIAEVLAGGKTGRTCHRSGPTISIGRSGCDMNFPADGVLAARHAEIRLAEDGSASLVDLGAGDSGVWLRVRQQASFDLVPGDRLQIGEQLLRLEVG